MLLGRGSKVKERVGLLRGVIYEGWLTPEETTAHPIEGVTGKKIIQDVRNSIAANKNKSNKGFDVTSGIPTNEI